MESEFLPPEQMLPSISLCRYFDTRYAPVGKSRKREALCYEIAYYFEGGGSIIIGDTEHKVTAGDIRFSIPGEKLCSVPDYKCYTLYFDLGKSGVVYSNPILNAIPGYFHASGAFRDDFAEFITVFKNGGVTSGIKLNAMLLDLICKIYDHISSKKNCSDGVKMCLEYMQTNFSENISLEDLGRICGYSPLHVLRLFKAELGFSPHQYLTDLRINSAKQLLINSVLPLDEVAKRCGFSSESHFNGLFKKNTGFTPGSYRRNSY